jgi:hypothetical protein
LCITNRLATSSTSRRISRFQEFCVCGGGGGILSIHPKKFPVAMVKLKSFVVNERIFQKPFCQCHWEI